MSKASMQQPDGPSRRKLLTSATLMAAAASVGVVSGKTEAHAATPVSDLGGVWWSELQTPDPARARKFYSAVMGWTPKIVSLTDSSRPPAQGEKDYTLFTIEGREVAGAMQTEGDADTPAAIWLTYIHVANVDVAALKAIELGGKLLEPPSDAPGTGRIAVIEDPDGVRVGLIKPV